MPSGLAYKHSGFRGGPRKGCSIWRTHQKVPMFIVSFRFLTLDILRAKKLPRGKKSPRNSTPSNWGNQPPQIPPSNPPKNNKPNPLKIGVFKPNKTLEVQIQVQFAPQLHQNLHFISANPSASCTSIVQIQKFRCKFHKSRCKSRWELHQARCKSKCKLHKGNLSCQSLSFSLEPFWPYPITVDVSPCNMLRVQKKPRTKSTVMDAQLLGTMIDSWLCHVGCRDVHMVLEDLACWGGLWEFGSCH